MRIRFWGVRGSTPTPQAENLRYGGNTPCLELRSNSGSLLIVDCGSGLRMLGRELERQQNSPITANILLSHYHWDHIQGLPFFVPLYSPKNSFHFYALESEETTLQSTLEGQMGIPYFPVDMTAMLAKRDFTEIGETVLPIEDFKISTRRVNHPQGCLSFRIENDGKVLVYATDNEPGSPQGDRNVRELALNSDLMIYDSQYTADQLQKEKRGWGHSSWEEGVRICQETGVKELVLFHHDPDREDASVDKLLELARERFPNTGAAHEGLEIIL